MWVVFISLIVSKVILFCVQAACVRELSVFLPKHHDTRTNRNRRRPRSHLKGKIIKEMARKSVVLDRVGSIVWLRVERPIEGDKTSTKMHADVDTGQDCTFSHPSLPL